MRRYAPENHVLARSVLAPAHAGLLPLGLRLLEASLLALVRRLLRERHGRCGQAPDPSPGPHPGRAVRAGGQDQGRHHDTGEGAGQGAQRHGRRSRTRRTERVWPDDTHGCQGRGQSPPARVRWH